MSKNLYYHLIIYSPKYPETKGHPSNPKTPLYHILLLKCCYLLCESLYFTRGGHQYIRDTLASGMRKCHVHWAPYFSRVPNLPPSQTLWMRKLDAGDVNQDLQEAENRGGGYFRDVPRCPGCRCTRPRLLLADQSVSSECWPVSAAGDGMLPSCSPLCPLSTFLFSLVSGQVGS